MSRTFERLFGVGIIGISLFGAGLLAVIPGASAEVFGICCGKSVLLSETGVGLDRNWSCARELGNMPVETQDRVCSQLSEAGAVCQDVADVCSTRGARV